MKNILFISILGIVAFSACSKKNNINGNIGNRDEILTSRHWQITSKKANNSYVDIKSCEKDNYFVFETSGNGRWEEGNNNCFAISNSGSDSTGAPIPTATYFTWSITGDQRIIYIKNFGKDGYNPEWQITNMDYSSLDVRTSQRVDNETVVYDIHLVAL